MTDIAALNCAIGRRIRHRRRLRGFSQAELGRRVRRSMQQICKYELGQDAVSAPLLLHLAAALGCDPADLLPRALALPCEAA